MGIAGLVILGLQGPLIGERAGKQLEKALHANGPGPLGEPARRMTRHRGLWITEFSAIGIVLGVVWNMTEKPGTAGSVAAVVVGYAVGAVLALYFTKAPAEELAAVAEPAA
jgi:hypothetical protein